MYFLEIGDIETLSNFFSYTGYCPKENKWYQFVIHKLRNDLEALVSHLKNKERKVYWVGFNSEAFDYPILHHILNHYEEYKYLTGQELACKIYEKSQAVIDMEFPAIGDKNKHFPNLDLFKVWHFDNKGRACSLKHLEVAMRMHNVEDMPIHHTKWITTWDEIELILGYNKNDVEATYQFFLITIGKTDHVLYKGKDKLELRKKLQKQYGLKCLNYPDVKIGEELLLKLYCNATGQSPYLIKKMKTYREYIDLGQCILPYIEFKTPAFKALKNWLMNQKITSTSGAFSNLSFESVKELIPYMHPEMINKRRDGTRDVKSLNLKLQSSYLAYGTGGIHHSINGRFCSDDEWIILDIDVGSMYPSIAVVNNFFPQHLGEIFASVYDDNIVSVRLGEKKKPKKERDFVIMEGFKLAANGTYGKSGEESSFLYDPMYTMKTTINGQLLLSMLIEELLINIKSVLFIQCNTDGVTVRIKRIELDRCLQLCKEWEDKTKLELEYNYYKMIAVVDVSTYIAVYEDGGIKQKSDFEVDKELYKNPSMRIVPIALREYFVNNIPIEETIKNHKDIFDFCLMVRCNKAFDLYYRYIKDSKVVQDKAAKTQRYFASTIGGVLYKHKLETNSYTGVNVGQTVTLFNQYIEKPMEDYNIDYGFYINEARKIINKIELSANQQSLF